MKKPSVNYFYAVYALDVGRFAILKYLAIYNTSENYQNVYFQWCRHRLKWKHVLWPADFLKLTDIQIILISL